MCQPKFEDKHEYSTSGYDVTNEEPEVHRFLLGSRHPKKIGAIASSGEILLMVLLPKGGEVVAVDHSYQSLMATYTKVLLLDKLGGKKLRDLILEGTIEGWKKEQDTIKAQIPEKVVKGYEKWLGSSVYNSYSYGYGGSFSSLRREWFQVSPQTLERSRSNLSNLTIIHGDLADLLPYAPFDLLYLSNALEHNANRNNKKPAIDKVLEVVGKRGLVLTTWNSSYGAKDQIKASEWDLVKKLTGFRTNWYYIVYRRAKMVKVEVKAC